MTASAPRSEAIEEMELSDDELTEAPGGVMIKPSQRYRATCGVWGRERRAKCAL